jgi:hypothetical protein
VTYSKGILRTGMALLAVPGIALGMLLPSNAPMPWGMLVASVLLCGVAVVAVVWELTDRAGKSQSWRHQRRGQ